MTHHASIWLDKAAGPTARACSAVALHARRIHARKCYSRPPTILLLARRSHVCGRRALLQPRRPTWRDVLEPVIAAASRRQLHMLMQQANLPGFIAAAALLRTVPENWRRPLRGLQSWALSRALRLLVLGVLDWIEPADGAGTSLALVLFSLASRRLRLTWRCAFALALEAGRERTCPWRARVLRQRHYLVPPAR